LYSVKRERERERGALNWIHIEFYMAMSIPLTLLFKYLLKCRILCTQTIKIEDGRKLEKLLSKSNRSSSKGVFEMHEKIFLNVEWLLSCSEYISNECICFISEARLS
jgi:hypothetical protein